MTDHEFEALKERCRQMRLRGLAGHPSYHWSVHYGLYQKYLHEKSRRDAAEIDAAMAKMEQLLEAAG